MRRSIVALAVIATAAARAGAGDPAPAPAPQASAARTCENGELFDPYWALTMELPGLTDAGRTVAPAIFSGRAGETAVEIDVVEGDAPVTPLAAREAATKAWTAKRREMKSAASGDDPVPWTTFVEKDLSGLDRQHAYAFFARGLQAFVVHAFTDTPTAGSGAALVRAATALRLGEDRGASLLADKFAESLKLPADSAGVTLVAAQFYIDLRAQSGLDMPAMTEHVLGFAVKRLKPADMTAEQVQRMHELLGLATLKQRKTDAAIAWFTKSAELAQKTKQAARVTAVSLYNLACAYSVAGRSDDAFAALERAYVSVAPVSLNDLRTDGDFDNLRKDPRWNAFLAKQTAAAAPK